VGTLDKGNREQTRWRGQIISQLWENTIATEKGVVKLVSGEKSSNRGPGKLGLITEMHKIAR